MLRLDENRERIAYTCIMYMYMYIIIFLTYIYIFISRILLLKFISSFFFFSRDDGIPTDVTESGEGRPSGVFFLLFFFSFWIKRKVPSSPRPPHIFNTRFVLQFFLFFFPFFFCYYYTCTHGRITESLATRARVFHDSNYAFFSLFLSHSLFLYFALSFATLSLS